MDDGVSVGVQIVLQNVGGREVGSSICRRDCRGLGGGFGGELGPSGDSAEMISVKKEAEFFIL